MEEPQRESLLPEEFNLDLDAPGKKSLKKFPNDNFMNFQVETSW